MGVSDGSDESHWSSLVKATGGQFEQYDLEGLWDMGVRWVGRSSGKGGQVGHKSR
jgi:hypothetical protein